MAENQTLLGLKIMDLLKTYSDEKHTLTQKDILDLLESKYNTGVDRKTINRNMEALIEYDEQNGEHICYETITRSNGAEVRKGFYYRSDFEEGEMRVLTDSILSNRHISMKYTKELIEKICGMNSIHYKNRMKDVVFYDSYFKQEIPDLFYNTELIADAIDRKKNVRFSVGTMEADLKLVPGRERNWAPVQLFMVEQAYYMIAMHPIIHKGAVVGNKPIFRIFRVADLTSIRILEKSENNAKEIFEKEKPGLDFAKLMEKMPYMEGYLNAEVETMKFVIPKQYLWDVVNRFGYNIRVKEITESNRTIDKGNHAYKNPLVMITVQTTREALKHFKFEHLTHMYIVEPTVMNLNLGENIGIKCFLREVSQYIPVDERCTKRRYLVGKCQKETKEKDGQAVDIDAPSSVIIPLR